MRSRLAFTPIPGRGRLGQVYNEEAFRYFLAIERKRSERSGRPFLLVTVDLKEQPGVSTRIDPVNAARLFAGLRLHLRETDLLGWYRKERVAGAVLTELGDGSPAEVSRVVGQRVSGVLGQRLPPDLARRLTVRAYHPEPERTDSGGGFSPVQPDVLRLGLSSSKENV